MKKQQLGGLDRAQYVYATWLRDGKATEKNESLAMEFFQKILITELWPRIIRSCQRL